MSESRSTVFHCPYCGEETLRPYEEPHGAWECQSCARVFLVKLTGIRSGREVEA